MRIPTATLILASVILLLAIIASAGGMLRPEIYRDNEFVRLAWSVNDPITLFVAVPVMGLAVIATVLGSLRGLLVWCGMLGYMIYNYAFYLFGAAFNPHFLLYVSLFILPVICLILLLGALDARLIRSRFPSRSVAGAIGSYMILWGALLGIVWCSQAIDHIRTGALPEMLQVTGSEIHLIAALDLALVVPFFLLSGWMLWRDDPWGVIIGVISNVKGAIYCVVLAWGARAGEEQGFGGGELFPLWIAACVFSSASAAGLLWRMHMPEASEIVVRARSAG